jgi:hypothetical protein
MKGESGMLEEGALQVIRDPNLDLQDSLRKIGYEAEWMGWAYTTIGAIWIKGISEANLGVKLDLPSGIDMNQIYEAKLWATRFDAKSLNQPRLQEFRWINGFGFSVVNIFKAGSRADDGVEPCLMRKMTLLNKSYQKDGEGFLICYEIFLEREYGNIEYIDTIVKGLEM